MANVPLNCGVNDLVVDAASITLNGPIQMGDFGAGVLVFDASGNVSSVAGAPFSVGANYSPSGTWTFSNTVTCSAALLNPGITTQASVLGVTIQAPPTGYSVVIVNDSTGQFYRMT